MESIKAFNKTKDLQVTATDVGDKRALDVSIISGGSGSVSDYSTLIDEPTAGIMYIGKATSGSSTSSAVWQIKKLTESGVVTSILFANGSNEFNNIWSNRASLTYT
jgi:hypothetical protein